MAIVSLLNLWRTGADWHEPKKIDVFNKSEGRKKSKIMRILRLLLMKIVCRPVEFLTWEFSILLWGTPDSVVCRILDSTKEFCIRRGNSAYALDRLSILKIDKISGSRSVCLYATVWLYLHQRLAYSESRAFLAIFANYLYEISWPMSDSQQPVWRVWVAWKDDWKILWR